MHDPRDFIRPDGSIDTAAAMAAGRRARSGAAHTGMSELKRVFVGEPRTARRFFR